VAEAEKPTEIPTETSLTPSTDMQPETPALSVSDMEGETALERPEIKAHDYPWVTIASCSDVGLVRSKNDDRLLVKAWPNDEALLLVVADGLGGSQSGGLAAELACATLAQLVEKPLPQTPKARYEALVEGFYAADQVILTEGGKSFQTLGMGCTAVAAIVTPQDYVYLYAGDSRLYHIRSGQVLHRSRDHSIVELLLASGRITEAEIPKHPMRSVVNSCLGGNRSSEHFTIDPKWDEAQPPIGLLQTQDWLLLSTDGFHGTVSDQVLYQEGFGPNALSPSPTPPQVLQRLGQFAFEQGGKDNLSAIALCLSPPSTPDLNDAASLSGNYRP